MIWSNFHTAAKSLQSCPTLCDPIDGSPPASPVPGILQARTLEWVAISFSNAWKWKWSLSVVSNSSRPHGLQPTRLLHPWDFPGKSTRVGCYRLLHRGLQGRLKKHPNCPVLSIHCTWHTAELQETLLSSPSPAALPLRVLRTLNKFFPVASWVPLLILLSSQLEIPLDWTNTF